MKATLELSPSNSDALNASPNRSIRKIAIVLVFGAFASVLDASLTNIGLNTIGVDLHASLANVQWVANGYLVAMAISLPLCGWIGRRIGMGRLWLFALAAFTVTSGLCACAGDLGWLVGLRILQGLTAGLLIPAGQTIIGQAVDQNRLGRVMSVLGMVVAVAPALGPVIGGIMLHWLSWQWLYLINLPIGVVGLSLGLRWIPRGTKSKTFPLDWLGFFWISIGLSLVIYALAALGSGSDGNMIFTIILLVLGIAALTAFGMRTARRAKPLLDLSLYRNKVYLLASLADGFSGALQFGSVLIFPLYFENLFHDSALSSGIRLLALGLASGAIVPIGGWLTDRYGGGIVSTVGAICALLAIVPFTLLTTSATSALFEVLLVLFGFAIGLTAISPALAAFKAVKPVQLPDAATQINIVQRVGSAIGGALFTIVLANNSSSGDLAAFHATFWWVFGAIAVTLVFSLLLHRASSKNS